MTLKRRIRPLAGFAAVLTLLILMTADTIHPQVTLTIEDKAILISLISALLGVDIALDQLPIGWNKVPIRVQWTGPDTDPGPDQQSEEGNGGEDDD